VIGYTDLPKLIIAIERRHLTLESQTDTRRAEEETTDTVSHEHAAQLATV
jgi:hypothetical protein